MPKMKIVEAENKVESVSDNTLLITAGGFVDVSIPYEVARDLSDTESDTLGVRMNANLYVEKILVEMNGGKKVKSAITLSVIHKAIEQIKRLDMRENITDIIYDFCDGMIYLMDEGVWNAGRAYNIQLALQDISSSHPGCIPDSGRLDAQINRVKNEVTILKARSKE